MNTVYYLIEDIELLQELSIEEVIPNLAWSAGQPSEGMLSIEANLTLADIAQLAVYLPSKIKGIKPGPRCGSPT